MKKTKKIIKKVVIIFVLVLLALILIIGISAAVSSKKNVKAMDNAIDGAVSLISERYNVTPVSIDEYEKIKVYGVMKFHVKQYDVEGLGNLSVMKVNVGLMQMATLVLTPQDRNLPMVSADHMCIFGNRKSYFEFYDLVEAKDEAYNSLISELQNMNGPYSGLKDIEMDPAWYDNLKTFSMYKSGKTADDKALAQMYTDGLEIYLNAADKLPQLTDAQKAKKNEITKNYTEGLITKGGVSTDAFKKSLGEDKTRDFFSKVLFGTENVDQLQ